MCSSQPMDIRPEKINRRNKNYPSDRLHPIKRNIFKWRAHPMGCVAIILIWLKSKEIKGLVGNEDLFAYRGQFPTYNGPGS